MNQIMVFLRLPLLLSSAWAEPASAAPVIDPTHVPGGVQAAGLWELTRWMRPWEDPQASDAARVIPLIWACVLYLLLCLKFRRK